MKDRKTFKARFKRQHPIDIFIVDFYCHECKLAIEVDGDIHLKKEIQDYDIGRSSDLEKLGIKTLRFKNDDILNNIEIVKKRILNEINELTPL